MKKIISLMCLLASFGIALTISDFEKIMESFEQTIKEMNTPKCQSERDKVDCYQIVRDSISGKITQYIWYMDKEVQMLYKVLYENPFATNKKTGFLKCDNTDNVIECQVYKLINGELEMQNLVYGQKAKQIIDKHSPKITANHYNPTASKDENKAMECFGAMLELTKKYPHILEGDMLNEKEAQQYEQELIKIMTKEYGNTFTQECIRILNSSK